MNRQQLQRERPSGAILVVALVSLLVSVSLVGTLLQSTLQSRRQMRIDQRVRQVELLLDAACRRAKLRLASDPEYEEEEWTLASPELGISGEADVSIRISDGQVTAQVIHTFAAFGRSAPSAEQTTNQQRKQTISRSRSFSISKQQPPVQES